MKVVILGGAGFIGTHIAEAFLKERWDVAVFDRPEMESESRAILGNIPFIAGDFMNVQDLSRAISGADVVVHLICTTLPASSNENPVFDVETNVAGTLRLLETVRECGVRRIVFASSGGTVYGPPSTVPINENHPTDPICSYGISKLAIEKYLALYHHLYDLKYCALRIGNPYGERQRSDGIQGVIATFLKKAFDHEPARIWGDGSVARDFLYIRDLARAFVNAASLDAPVGVFNISSGAAVTLNEIVDIIREVTGCPLEVMYSEKRKLDVPVNYLDITKAHDNLDWSPEVSLKEGIGRTFRWLSDNRNGKA